MQMQVQSAEAAPPPAPTREIAEWAAGLDPALIGPSARAWARHAVLDILGVAIAGAREPLVEILVGDALADGGAGRAGLLGRSEQVTPGQAALINGAAAHALDYDDVNESLNGHPTAPLFPALLAAAAGRPVSGRDVLTAFIIGYEAECLIGRMMGRSHYAGGWHNTATIGTFGAAIGCARLLGLSAAQTATAMGIAASQAAGLKSNFGTMTKPLHAGKAAANGLLAARLAAAGFTARQDALECEQGFGASQSQSFAALPVRPDPAAPFAVERTLFKYHAACYLTHAGIDAARRLCADHGLAPDQVVSVRLRIHPASLGVCAIPEPVSGLEVKFSLRHMIAMALCGEDTAALATYSDAMAVRPDLVGLRGRVVLEPDDNMHRYATQLVVALTDGRSLVGTGDSSVPALDPDQQWARLADKFHSLVTPVLGAAAARAGVAAIQGLDEAATLDGLMLRAD